MIKTRSYKKKSSRKAGWVRVRSRSEQRRLFKNKLSASKRFLRYSWNSFSTYLTSLSVEDELRWMVRSRDREYYVVEYCPLWREDKNPWNYQLLPETSEKLTGIEYNVWLGYSILNKMLQLRLVGFRNPYTSADWRIFGRVWLLNSPDNIQWQRANIEDFNNPISYRLYAPFSNREDLTVWSKIDTFNPEQSKKKNHQHHIIPFYNPIYFNLKNSNLSKIAINKLDKYLSVVPFYYSLVISFSSLLLLFFIFLHKYDIITSVSIFYNFELFLSNSVSVILFYGILIFYVVIFFHSLFKFFIHIFAEVRSPHIYTKKVEVQNLLGISLFILSEAMLFFAFFWAFFHASLTPSIFVGNCWPPVGIQPLNPWHLPLLNTVILLTSGMTVNWFFFSLKRLTYVTFKFNIQSTKENSSGFALYSTIFDFFFIDHKKRNLNISIINPQTGLFKFINKPNLIKALYFQIKVSISFFKKVANYVIYKSYIKLVTVYAYHNGYFPRTFLLPKRWSRHFIVKTAGLPLTFNKFNYEYGSFLTSSLHYSYRSILTLWVNYFSFYFLNLTSILNRISGHSLKQLLISILDPMFLFQSYLYKSFKDVFMGLLLTLYLGCMFIIFQFCEYEFYASFGVDTIFGTVFYSLTLLHGFHVYVGLFSLSMCFSFFNSFILRKSDLNKGLFTHFWIIFSVWYWHFVDIVWIFLFIVVYIWGS